MKDSNLLSFAARTKKTSCFSTLVTYCLSKDSNFMYFKKTSFFSTTKLHVFQDSNLLSFAGRTKKTLCISTTVKFLILQKRLWRTLRYFSTLAIILESSCLSYFQYFKQNFMLFKDSNFTYFKTNFMLFNLKTSCISKTVSYYLYHR